MINKYQQGGSVIQQIQQLPKELQEQIMQAFALWAQEKGIDIQQIQQDTNSLEQALVQFIQETQQQLVQAAKHGAKLKYVKSLKNMCEEDEELYYYKKGGSLGCGCRKKENGGEIKKAETGMRTPVERFKINRNDTVHVNGKPYSITYSDGTKKNPKSPYPKYSHKQYVEDRDNTSDKEAQRRVKKVDKATKDEEMKCGGMVKKHQKGSIISKFKKHQLGGSLNGIPFYLKGTPKKGVLRNIYKNPQINYYELSTGTNPMWYRFAYPNQNYILSDNDLGKPGEGIVFVSDERVPGSYLGGTYGGWNPTIRKSRFVTPRKFIGSLYNTWEAFADSIRNANGFKPAQNRKVKK